MRKAIIGKLEDVSFDLHAVTDILYVMSNAYNESTASTIDDSKTEMTLLWLSRQIEQLRAELDVTIDMLMKDKNAPA